MSIVIASENKGKIAEFELILGDMGQKVISASSLGVKDYPPEDGDSYEANALIKARYVSQQTGLVAIADDSGLEVEALDNAPGIYSARYGQQANDEARVLYLLEQLQKASNPSRRARFISAISLYFPSGNHYSFRGECSGQIMHKPKGEYGFGYDPIFFSDDLAMSFAEAKPSQKKTVSHRGRALAEFRTWLSTHKDMLSS